MNDNMIFNTNKGVTVRELVELLQDCKKMYISENGGMNEFNHRNPLCLSAFGDFVVSRVFLHHEDTDSSGAVYELELSTAPVKRSSNDF